MRKFNDLREARKRYHESIGFDQSRVSEGHVQVEYARRALERISRPSRSPREQFLPPAQAKQPTVPDGIDHEFAESRSSTPKPSQLVDMRPERNTGSSQYLDRSGNPVRGYESHCTSLETNKPKQRPYNIATMMTWSKVLPTVIEHNPVSSKPAARKNTTDNGREKEEF